MTSLLSCKVKLIELIPYFRFRISQDKQGCFFFFNNLHIKHMVDADMIMTPEEEERFEESMKDLKEGKTTSLSDIKKELGL